MINSKNEFQGLLQHLTTNWTLKQIGFGHDKADRGKGAQVVRTMKAMSYLVEDMLQETKGRVSYWVRADRCHAELMDIRWHGNWSAPETWEILRSWNESLGNNEDTP